MHRPVSSLDHRRMRRALALRRGGTALAFLAPALLCFIPFLLLPVIALAWQSLQVGGVMSPARFVGLDNWAKVFRDPLVLVAVRNTLVYSVIAIPSVFVLAMILALCLGAVRRGATVFKTLIYLPTLQPMLLVALMFTFVLHPDFGVLNILIHLLTGKTVNFLGDVDKALPTIAGVEVWKGLGFWVLLFLAGIKSLPRDLYYAADLDGAGPVRRFAQLTLPLMQPTFFFAAIFATIVNMQLFDSVFVLTDGGPARSTVTVTWYLYRSLFSFNQPGFGAALALVLVMVVLLLTLVQGRLLGGRRS